MPLWGDTDTRASAPKYITGTDLDDIVFVDNSEAAVAASRNKGVRGPGWYRYIAKTVGGVTRHQFEKLVAMKRTAALAGDTGVEIGVGGGDTRVSDDVDAKGTLTP